MKRILYLLACLFSVPVILVALFFVVWQIYWIEDTVTEGEAYGYVIGQEREETFRLVKSYAEEKGYDRIVVDNSNVAIENVSLQALNESVGSKDFWYITIGEFGSHPNILRLYFKDNRLSKVYRGRQWFELP